MKHALALAQHAQQTALDHQIMNAEPLMEHAIQQRNAAALAQHALQIFISP